jgi:hypothetical protein
MANKSLVLVVSTPRATGDVTDLIKSTSTPRDEMMALSLYFKRLAEGCDKGVGTTVYASYSTSAPVRATNTLTLTYASIANNDTVVIAGTTLTCVTGTPTPGTQFKKLTDATVTAANLVVCVNANTTLNKLMVATSVAGVVTLTLIAFGAIGNQTPLVGSTGMVVGAAVFASGAGGAEVANVSYSRG